MPRRARKEATKRDQEDKTRATLGGVIPSGKLTPGHHFVFQFIASRKVCPMDEVHAVYKALYEKGRFIDSTGELAAGPAPSELNNIITHLGDKLAPVGFGVKVIDWEGDRVALLANTRTDGLAAHGHAWTAWQHMVLMRVYLHLRRTKKESASMTTAKACDWCTEAAKLHGRSKDASSLEACLAFLAQAQEAGWIHFEDTSRRKLRLGPRSIGELWTAVKPDEGMLDLLQATAAGHVVGSGVQEGASSSPSSDGSGGDSSDEGSASPSEAPSPPVPRRRGTKRTRASSRARQGK